MITSFRRCHGTASVAHGNDCCSARVTPDSYGRSRASPTRGGRRAGHTLPLQSIPSEAVMGKYVIAWILGVPAVVLVGIYAFTHLL